MTQNDGYRYCNHGHRAAIVPADYGDDWTIPVAADCPVCAGEPCGIPRIDHGPPRRAPDGEKERLLCLPLLHHPRPLLLQCVIQ